MLASSKNTKRSKTSLVFHSQVNPIEHLWDELGRRVPNREPVVSNLGELRQAPLRSETDSTRKTRKISNFEDGKVPSCYWTAGWLYIILTGSSGL